MRRDQAERFWEKVDMLGQCWPWLGQLDKDGYGQFKDNGRTRGAHRVAYELYHTPISAGLVVRHKCDNPPCCNPTHLELGSTYDNNQDRKRRGGYKKKSHCKNNHPYSGDNVYVRPDGRGRGCKACRREAQNAKSCAIG